MIQALADPSADSLDEVVRGAYVARQPWVYECAVAGEIAFALARCAEPRGIGNVLVHALFDVPNSDNDRKPDVAFVSFARWAADKPTPRVNPWPVAPDLAVEVISPTDQAFDVLEKVHEYFAGGVRQVWHVDSHAEQVFVFESPRRARVFNRNDEIASGPVVPGFRATVSNLFTLAEPRK